MPSEKPKPVFPSCVDGTWSVAIDIGDIVRTKLHLASGGRDATLVHGSERIKLTAASFDSTSKTLTLKMPHYDSTLVARAEKDCTVMSGFFSKQRKNERVEYQANLRKGGAGYASDPSRAATFRYAMKFEDSGEAIGKFKIDDTGRMTGTILTPTGDYRFLEGGVTHDGAFRMSAFDFAHVFLFSGQFSDDRKTMNGRFLSGKSWKEKFSGVRDPSAKLPDGFLFEVGQKMSMKGPFYDLDGKSYDSLPVAGPTVVEFMGTWCPNCNDAAKELEEIYLRHKDEGVQVIGVAFELTGDRKRDLEQVRRYKAFHKISFPLFLGGVADKKEAGRRMPFLDELKAWPTTVFVNRGGKITGIHSGYAGPAAPEEHENQKKRYAALLLEMKKNLEP